MVNLELCQSIELVCFLVQKDLVLMHEQIAMDFVTMCP